MSGEAPFPILDVSSWPAIAPEQMGTKAKQWIEDPDGRRWLFKEVRAKAMPSGATRTFGEDWSEKLGGAMAQLLGMPAAVVELARRSGRRGIISCSVLPDGDHALVHGNELLQQHDPDYDRDQVREAAGYRLSAVWQALAGHAAPSGAPLGIADAPATFAGYLLFDALMANRDRHHENWAVVFAPDGRTWLSPSYDHATSLGFQEPEERKLEIVRDASGDKLERWASRGTSSHFEGRPSLVQLAVEALERLDAGSAATWRARLADLDLDVWREGVARVPVELMSHGDRMFAFELVRWNREGC